MKARDFLKVSAKGGAVVAVAVFAQTLVGFVTQVALARILAPEVFGRLAFATTAAMFFNALTNLRGDAYVIQQKGSPRHAVDVAFTLELAASAVFVALVFLIAPPVMGALGKGDLTIYVQILSLSFFYNPFSRTRCLLERELSFFRSKTPFLAAQLFGSVTSIALAVLGYGILSLLWWRLSVLFGEVFLLWISAPYRPRLRWDTEQARRLILFTWPLVGSATVSYFCYNIDYFIVGKFLGDMELGYYWLGFQAAAYLLLARQILYQVLFPVFSRMDDEELKRQAFLRFSRAVAGIFTVLTVVAVLFGRDLILFLYGAKWEPAVFPFQIVFVAVMMRAINANMGYYFYSSGNTRPEFVSVLLTSIFLAPAAYFGTLRFGINGTAMAVLTVQIIVSVAIYEWYVRPMAGHGVLHFFAWPWLVSALSLALALGAEHFALPALFWFASFGALILLTYWLILRPVWRDVKKAVTILKPDGR